jgi:hypothetical protein
MLHLYFNLYFAMEFALSIWISLTASKGLFHGIIYIQCSLVGLPNDEMSD